MENSEASNEQENLQQRRLKIRQIRHEVSNSKIISNGIIINKNSAENHGEILLSDLKLVFFNQLFFFAF